MDIETQIRKFLLSNFILGEQLEELQGDDSFLEKGIIDSTGVLELIFFAEDQFGIQVDDHEVVPENFDSINRFAQYLNRKLASS